MTNTSGPIHFRHAQQKAVGVVNNKNKFLRLLDKAQSKAIQHKDRIEGFRGHLFSLVRLLTAWTKGKYKTIPVNSILTVMAAVIYFVNPFDLVPDFIPVIGYLDDASIIAFVIKSLKSDIEKFTEWEANLSELN
jgi:uncharacterized membrane protein YkvA (DUF1232 family)